ncbi:ribosome recycling factor [Candidatus Rhabdochlamydia porcellionis]|jgi:ribosome recycling factor|uniref:Ribosome-recycling factor n=1 Tax=Candidatus Rhabdochlamydia porcellionis TaxID=225148 RepID=A0ABX8Z0Y7_9BACT|nr:ribosome recycling factor [Candidatus Rhabdochlamydia porcellionis]QZA59344.1 Ribosome-recycling factor [Candidatus Rhabdochlamydia porcellionis]
MNIVKQTESKMKTSLEHFKDDLKSLRSNRANPAILDSVFVEAYGSKMRIKELASITTPESRQILISPFDPQMLQSIAKGIEKDHTLNLRPVIEGSQIRMNIPPMDGSMREKLAKQVDAKTEEQKIAIRGFRQSGNESIRKQKAEGLITEDMMKKDEKEIQKLTDTFCKEIENIAKAKKQELMTV